MKIETRIVFFINKLKVYLKRKNSFFKEVFSFALFTLFFGFLIGNLFGTFLNTIRSFILWDGFIIFIILVIMEFLNFLLYNKAKRFFVIFQRTSYYSNNQIIWKSLNYLKIGIMFGFFIDAFKVGS
jgi:cytochrome c biogenesis protein CcdA